MDNVTISNLSIQEFISYSEGLNPGVVHERLLSELKFYIDMNEVISDDFEKLSNHVADVENSDNKVQIVKDSLKCLINSLLDAGSLTMSDYKFILGRAYTLKADLSDLFKTMKEGVEL